MKYEVWTMGKFERKILLLFQLLPHYEVNSTGSPYSPGGPNSFEITISGHFFLSISSLQLFDLGFISGCIKPEFF